MTAVIYARCSSDNQREESIEGQIRECTAYVVQPNAIPALVSGELVGARPLHLAAQDRSVA